jgi:FAD/FMN-containing dehydrogenase
MRAVEESFPCGYPLDAAAVLIAEVDGPAAGMREQVERIKEICQKNGCRTVREAKDAAERDLLWSGRRGAFGAVARLAPNYLVADCSVPRTRLPDALAHVAGVAQRYGLPHANVFHAGDGNLHPLLFFDSRDRDQLHRVHEAGWEIMKGCVDLGGTITGEHGVGSEKAKAMRMVFSEDDLEFQFALRRAFDPDGLLNPRKIFPGEPRIESTALAPAAPSAPPEQLVPADPKEAVEMVREALSRRVALLPIGGGSQRDYGNQLTRPALPLCSSRLCRVIEYDPANQVVTVGAGMPLRELQSLLASHNQWLPVVPPRGQCSALGSIVALGSCGPNRLRHGAPRDMILGLRFVSGRGKLIRGGGKVVKNVAGYDVTRLMAGSAGTLGFLTDITFKVAPLPEVDSAVRGIGPLEVCGAAAAELLRSRLEPVSIVAEPWGDNEWELAAGFEGFEPTVQWQTGQAAELMARLGMGRVGTAGYDCHHGTGRSTGSVLDYPCVVRADLPLDRAVAFVQSLHALATRPCAQVADLGCGRVRAGFEKIDESAWGMLCNLAGDHEGHVILESAPALLKERVDVFGPCRAEWQVMHRIKERLDPESIFSPGRLPGRK